MNARIALSLGAALALGMPVAAQTGHAQAKDAPPADASVKVRLDERGIKYTVDGDGDFKVVYNYSKEKRTQLVYVAGRTQKVGGFLVREVFSPAGKLKEDGINGAKALDLLAKNRDLKIGAWETAGNALFFVIKLPDDASAAQLESAMDIAAETADDMEITLSGAKDEL